MGNKYGRLLPRGQHGRGVKLAIHIHLVARLRMRPSRLSLHSMTWCLIKHTDNFTFLSLYLDSVATQSFSCFTNSSRPPFFFWSPPSTLPDSVQWTVIEINLSCLSKFARSTRTVSVMSSDVMQIEWLRYTDTMFLVATKARCLSLINNDTRPIIIYTMIQGNLRIQHDSYEVMSDESGRLLISDIVTLWLIIGTISGENHGIIFITFPPKSFLIQWIHRHTFSHKYLSYV
jgi:hypothetical protein